MASKHELIVNKLRIRWSAEKRGRLYLMRVGKAVPLNGSCPVDFGAGVKGFSDMVGFTLLDGQPVFTVIEVKTRRDTIRPDQRLFLDYIASIGGHAYIAREDGSEEGYKLTRWGE